MTELINWHLYRLNVFFFFTIVPIVMLLVCIIKIVQLLLFVPTNVNIKPTPLIWSMLRTVVLLHITVKTVTRCHLDSFKREK